MAKRRAFRPLVSALEERVVASATPPLTTIPNPGNSFYSLGEWMSINAGLLAQAHEQRGGVVFLGDSLTALWGSTTTVGPGNAAWAQDFAPLHALNFGIAGDTTQSILWRVENGELADHPRAVVLMAGINNLMAGQSPTEVAAGDAAIVREIHKNSPRTKILLLGLLPAGGSPTNPLRGEIGETNALLQDVANGRDVVSLDVGSALTEPDGTFIPGVMQTADLHMMAAGYDLIAPAIDAALLDLLRTR